MISWPLFISGLVLVITGGITAGNNWPSSKEIRDGIDNWTGPVVGLVLLAVGIASFLASIWVGFLYEGWGG
jgi:hypothetical protein